jgi:protein-S-isoprenylcysteine O-methyltransferase Ste14
VRPGSDEVTAGAGRHVAAAVLLPGIVAVAVPAALVAWTGSVNAGWGLPGPLELVPAAVGLVLAAAGVALFAWTAHLFARRGRGTLAPWDPTTRLVIEGPYRHVRNPMITAVGAVLAGETAALGSPPLALWLAGFALVNAVYIPLVEEPGLVRRFGGEYETYRANVPRWLPRVRPWDRPAGGGS